MNDQENAPPKEVGPGASTEADQDSHVLSTHLTAFDPHEALRRRREAAVRIPGGDPEIADNRYHRRATGLRASGFREGHAAARRDTCRRLWKHLTNEGRELASAIAGTEGGEDDD